MRYCLQLHGTMPAAAYPALAARAETLGFDDVTVHDLLLRRPVWPLLCEIARATRRVAVGPNVTHPYLQHPAVIAANIAHLAEISGDRAVLGIGRGSLYEVVNQAMPRGLDGLEDATKVIRALLAKDAQGVAGRVFSLEPGHVLLFGPPRRVPVYFGVYGPAGVRLAAATADGVRAAGQWCPDYALEMRRWIAESAQRVGRDPGSVDLILENWTVLGPDREVARREARVLLAMFLPRLGAMLDFYKIPAEEIAAARVAFGSGDVSAVEAISDSTLDRFMAAGDATDLRTGLDRLEAAGFARISFSGMLGPDTDAALEMIGTEISRRAERSAGERAAE